MNNIIESPKLGIKGTIESWEIINQDGSIERACYTPSNNMVLDCGLDMLANSSFWNVYNHTMILDYFSIGTGTALPISTDTILGHETYRSTAAYVTWNVDTASEIGSDPYYVTRQRGVQTVLGALNGTYTEIGFSPIASANGALFCKFRLVDEDGDPVSLAIASNQQLRLKYILTVQLTPATPTHYDTTITGIGSFGYTACWQNCSVLSNILNILCHGYYVRSVIRSATYSFSPIGTVVSFSESSGKSIEVTTEAYVTGSYTRYHNVTYQAIDAVWNNTALGISSQPYGISGANGIWVAAFDPASYIDKPNTYVLTLRFKFSWGRT